MYISVVTGLLTEIRNSKRLKSGLIRIVILNPNQYFKENFMFLTIEGQQSKIGTSDLFFYVCLFVCSKF